MAVFSEHDTIGDLTFDQLESMASSRHDILVDYLEHETIFDAHRIRLLLELGVREAKRSFELLS